MKNIFEVMNFRYWFFLFFAGIALVFFPGCEKEIQIDLPEAKSALVVEGKIETGQPPFVILTKSTGYFESTDINTFVGSFVHDAKITVTVDGVDFPLPELCLNNLPPEFKPLAATFLGIPEEALAGINYCIYTVPLADLFSGNFLMGVTGKNYSLTINSEGKTYSASTRIPELVPLDSVWFDFDGTDTLFGFAWGRLSDPDTIGNSFRWSAKRINMGLDGKSKDDQFVYSFGSAFNDKFFNGKSFDFGFDRGHRPSEEGEKVEGEKQHFFKMEDTIVVKFCTIEKPVMEFIRKYETEVWNNGNPFASPSSIPTNFKGGAFGLWAGYGASYDTIFGVKR